jgi:hypothetical protein
MRFAFVVLSCLLIAGCAMQPIAPEKAAQYKRVGILSAMGDRFALGALGLTVFGNDFKAEQLDFGADDILTARASEALSAKYTLIDLSRYRAAFMEAEKYSPAGRELFGDARPPAPDVVRRLMSAEALDAFILVTPARAGLRNTNQGVGGIGIVRLSGGLFESDVFLLHAAYSVSVIDGRDYSTVADMRAVPVGESGYTPLFLAKSALTAPNVRMPSPEPWQSPSTHKDDVRTAFEELIAKSMPETLRRARLVEQ